MTINYFERLKQFEALHNQRYQILNLRLPQIKEEYDELIQVITYSKNMRKNARKTPITSIEFRK